MFWIVFATAGFIFSCALGVPGGYFAGLLVLGVVCCVFGLGEICCALDFGCFVGSVV